MSAGAGSEKSESWSVMEYESDNEENESIEAWFGRRRPRVEAAELMGIETLDVRDDDEDIALRDLVMRPLTDFDTHAHPLHTFGGIDLDWFRPRPELFRIYGAAGAGATPNQRRHYTREWSYVDPYGQVSVYARPDRLLGRFAAGHSRTGGYGQALAAVGVVMVPDLEWCQLSIRPYVSYTGSFYLSGRRPEDAWENATSTGWASVGILVESWDVSGGSYRLDWDNPVVVSSFSQTNPTKSWRDFSGAVSVGDGLSASVFASSGRRYRIWVYAWAEVQAQMLVSAGAYATAGIDCVMPYLVVEQVKL